MAIVRTTKTKPKQKPFKPTRAKKPAKALTPAPKPDNEEDLLFAITEILDYVDEKMAEPRDGGVVHFGRYSVMFRNEVDALTDLTQRLTKLVNPKGRGDRPFADTIIAKRLGAPGGTVPSWARPGSFLMWIEDTPVRCVWGGLADPAADIVAADPRARFPSPAGAMSVERHIYPDYRTVKDLFRNRLEEATMAERTDYSKRPPRSRRLFNLFPLSTEGVSAAVKTMQQEDNAWITEALRRGPQEGDVIPLPSHLFGRPIPLFA